MRITSSEIEGVYILEPEFSRDDRGSFARIWCEKELSGAGLKSHFTQSSISSNINKGTLRGMHYQDGNHGEHKLIQVVRGSVHDVLLDLRKNSKTYKKWISIQLDANHKKLVYISPGIAHGFQTLEDDTEILYHMVEEYHPAAAKGFRYDDPAFNIRWPLSIPKGGISEKDLALPTLKEGQR